MPKRTRCVLVLLAATVFIPQHAGWSQTPVPVGRISGGDFRVRGQVEFAPDGNTLLLSGTEVEVRGGTARLALPGGEARFCGPLKVVVLKSATAAPASQPTAPARDAAADTPLLFALFSNDTGAIELEYMAASAYTIQTPFFSVATLPLPEPAPRKAAVRVSTTGEIAVAALTGSLRVREQLGTSDLLIPPGKAMVIPSAGVNKATPAEAEACGCKAPSRKVVEAPSTPTPVTPPAETKPAIETKTTIATPPLVYQADQKGANTTASRKEPEVTIPVVTPGAQPAPPATAQADQQPATAATAPSSAPPVRRGFGAKLKSLFLKLFGAHGN